MLFDTFNEFDRLTSAFLSAANGVPGSLSAPVNLYREKDRYVLDADLPGVDPQSIDVSVDDQWLTIRADRSMQTEDQDAQWIVRERTEASVVRRVAIGQEIDVDAIQAAYHNGVLRVVLPIVEAARPRKIQVNAAPAPERRVIGAAAAEPEPVEGKAQAAHSHAS